jgi:hypothetical protein
MGGGVWLKDAGSGSQENPKSLTTRSTPLSQTQGRSGQAAERKGGLDSTPNGFLLLKCTPIWDDLGMVISKAFGILVDR